jgi:PAS domain S-box-containing protein
MNREFSPRILLVEDEAIIALSEREMIERHGFSVEIAHTGEDAVAAMRNGQDYDLILMDIDLGRGMDGTEAAERILAESEVPIVFLTGHTEKEYVERVRSITSYGYIPKNSGEFVLAQSIRMALELFHAHRELAKNEQHYEFALAGGELGTWDWDVRTDHVTFNRYWAEMKGYSIDEIEPHYSSWEDRVHPDDLPQTLEKLHAHLEGKTEVYEAQFRMRRKTGEWMWIRDRGKVLERDLDGRPLRVCGTHCDITQVKRAQMDLEETTTDLQRSVRELECLHEIGGIVSTPGISLDALLQRIVDQIAESLSDDVAAISARIFFDGTQFATQEVTTTAHRRSTPVSVHGARRGSLEIAGAAGEGEEHSGFFSDLQTLLETIGERLGRIIERYEAEEGLRERERFSRITLGSIGDAVVATDRDGRITLANSTAERLAGLTFEEARGKRVTELVELVDSRDGKPVPDPIKTVLETDTTLQLSNHTLLRTKSGREFQVADSASPIKDGEDRTEGVVLVFRDETERYTQQERLRRSEELNRSILETSPVGITRVDRNGTVDFANREAEEILGLTRDDITERSYNDPAWRITAVDGTPYVDELLPFRLVQDSGRPVHGIEHAIEWPGGERKLLSISGSPLFDAQGEFDGMVSAIEDITERKRFEEELRAAVSDKTRLVREMNHRVKNNLTMVLSLVKLKDDVLGDVADLSDIRSQISAISFIHELLHQSADATHIDFRRYMEDLLPRVFSFYIGSSVSLRTDIDEILLPSDTAVTLGLIVNELATNAAQHGFTGEETPVFTVRFAREESEGETYTLTVANSGRPFPKDVGLENADTLGLQLITALVGQLGGRIDLQREPQPAFTIRF